MAYNAKGEWEDEDASVSKAVSGVISQGGPLMKQAAASGLQTAARRGLANSSMAVQASQAAVLDRAVPMGSQEASQKHQRNISGQEFRQQGVLQGRQLESTERIAAADRDAAMARLREQIGSEEKVAFAEHALRKQMHGETLTSQERISANELKAAADRLGIQIESDTNIANMNITASARNAATGAVIDSRNIMNNRINTINSNPNIPADVRAQMIEDARRTFDQDLTIIEDMYAIKLNWETAAPSEPAPAAPPAPYEESTL